jgi:hypothetical protein
LAPEPDGGATLDVGCAGSGGPTRTEEDVTRAFRALAVAIVLGTGMIVMASSPASAHAGSCFPYWSAASGDDHVAGYCSGSNIYYREYVTCTGTGSTKYWGPIKQPTTLSIAYCPSGRFVTGYGIDHWPH